MVRTTITSTDFRAFRGQKDWWSLQQRQSSQSSGKLFVEVPAHRHDAPEPERRASRLLALRADPHGAEEQDPPVRHLPARELQLSPRGSAAASSSIATREGGAGYNGTSPTQFVSRSAVAQFNLRSMCWNSAFSGAALKDGEFRLSIHL